MTILIMVTCSIEVFIGYRRPGQLKLVSIECTGPYNVFGIHMHERLLIFHFFLHDFRRGIDVSGV